MKPQLSKLTGQQHNSAYDQNKAQYDGKCRKDSSGSSGIEIQYRKTVALNFTIDNSGDQVTRDHEKNIDPDESTAESFGEGMEEHDRQNRERP
jgi:hypothetical protein